MENYRKRKKNCGTWTHRDQPTDNIVEIFAFSIRVGGNEEKKMKTHRVSNQT